MKKLLAVSMLFFLACSCDSIFLQSDKKTTDTGFQIPAEAPELTAAELEISDAVSLFGLEVFDRLLQNNETKSMMFSPMSLSLALSMNLAGAEGETAEQLSKVLGFDGLESAAVIEYYKKLIGRILTVDELATFYSANAIWVHNEFPVKSNYLANLGKNFDASAFNLDFGDAENVIKEINAWAEKKTNGTIKNMLKEAPIGPLVLANALYFKSGWGVEFDEELIEGTFYGSEGEVPCKFFTKTDLFNYGNRGEGYEILSIPYGKGAFEMVIVLPDEGISIKDAISWMKKTGMKEIEQMDATHGGMKLEVRIPCYTINSEFDNIKDILMDMGATMPFLANIADFSGISDSPLFIHKILQNTYIDVNEKGTESSAVTVVLGYTSDIEPQGPPLFYANRPFLFFIRETGSKTNIFVGVKQ